MPETVQQFFDTQVEAYSANFADLPRGTNFQFRTRLALTCELARGLRGRLLDCAVGTGEVTAAVLCQGSFSVATLVDLSAQMLQHCQHRLEQRTPNLRLNYVQNDIFAFLDQAPPTEQFDLVLCLGLIAHTGQLDQLLEKLRLRLSANGCIILQSTLLDHWGTRIVRALTKRRYAAAKGYGISYYTSQGIHAAAQSAGLRLLQFKRFCVAFPFGDKIWPAANYRLEQRGFDWASRHGAEGLFLLGR